VYSGVLFSRFPGALRAPNVNKTQLLYTGLGNSKINTQKMPARFARRDFSRRASCAVFHLYFLCISIENVIGILKTFSAIALGYCMHPLHLITHAKGK